MLCCREHKVGSFKCLGGFRNIRDEYDYEGFVLELDETIYPWGTVYEIEVETVRGWLAEFV